MTEEKEVFSFAKSKIFAEKLERKYPFLNCTIIGRSVSGRGIFAYCVGNTRNSVLLTGGCKAGDGQTSLALYRFIEKVCDSIYLDRELSGINFSALTKKFGVTIIPCLYPDSTEELSADNFVFDENNPEIRAFASLCRRRCFRSCLTIISGEDNIYYSLKDKTHISSPMMAKILASSCRSALSGEEIPPCPSRWFAGSFSKPSFLLSSRPCENSRMLYEGLEEALVLMSVM